MGVEIDNGRRAWISIPGIYEGLAGFQGGLWSFRPQSSKVRPGRYQGKNPEGEDVTFLVMKAFGWHAQLYPFLTATEVA